MEQDTDQETSISQPNAPWSQTRMVTPTEKAKELYHERKQKFLKTINNLWESVCKPLQTIRNLTKEEKIDIDQIDQVDCELRQVYKMHEKEAEQYVNFLTRSRSLEGRVDCELFEIESDDRRREFNQAEFELEKLKITLASRNSRKTSSKSNHSCSTHSGSSTMSTIIAKKRAKAEAERAKLKFTEKEIEMRRKKAEIEDDLKIMEQKKHIAAAEAEVNSLQLEDQRLSDFKEEDEKENRMEHTARYVSEQASVLNPDANSFRPTFQPTSQAENTVSDFANFILKKDLLMSNISTFNDQPEAYPGWKTSIKSATSQLNLAPLEELDLLIKWLGPDSRKQVLSIKSSCVSQPERGLEKAWERLEERYGSPELIEAAVKSKLTNFPKITNKEFERLYNLYDILSEIQSIKEQPEYSSLLAYYDSSSGILPIVNKLPYGLQEKWTMRAARYKQDRCVFFPPFTYFIEFVREMSKIKNDPSFQLLVSNQNTTPSQGKFHINFKSSVNAKKTSVSPDTKVCFLHKNKTDHTLNECRTFQTKTFQERKQFLKENNICFKCCDSTNHRFKDCTLYQNCQKCGHDKHATAMHLQRKQDGEGERKVTSKCTQICGNTNFSGKSCAKLVKVTIFDRQNPNLRTKAYAILDEQSNKTLACTELFDKLNLSCKQIEYSLSSCSGNVITSGRVTEDLVIESHDKSVHLDLPSVLECDDIPNIRDEIPTPEVARHYDHLKEISSFIPEVDQDCKILLLIGRDVTDAHYVKEQIIGKRGSPYAQKLALGWVIVGEACLGKTHKPERVNVNKTYILQNKRPSLFPPCTSKIQVKERISPSVPTTEESKIGDLQDDILFEKTRDDNKVGWSADDKKFINIMEDNFTKVDGNWCAPLPFQDDRVRLPNNRSQAFKRANMLDASLKKNPDKKQKYVAFMKQLIDRGHAEVAPALGIQEECWYLPHFGVFHPKKPDKIRVVFDSSSKFSDISLNDVLLAGPNLMNNLLGVLLRFRKEKVAAVADIEQMFYCFKVSKEHRNFLRFLWYRDNDLSKDMIDYRMCVHVFGNKPSPSVATYGLKKTAENCKDTYGSDVENFVCRNFYVDDGLISQPSIEATVDLMQRTQKGLQEEGNLRLHKILSNERKVMDAFPVTDLANDLKDLDLSKDELPMQRSLGMLWDLTDDSFIFKLSDEKKPFTRRGVLSVVNSIYDPMGFIAPLTIQGKLLLRDLMIKSKGWDDPLPTDRYEEWLTWRQSLGSLEALKIPRQLTAMSPSKATRRELHIFSDASEKAIAACAYIVTRSGEAIDMGFLLGKAKVAPKSGHTIPRLELCAAVLAIELYNVIESELELEFEEVRFYSDSKIVLGYIHNKKRRFYIYVGNRVEMIHQSSQPEQWSYIRSELNPADCATRPSIEIQQKLCTWIEGPSHLKETPNDLGSEFSLINEDTDKEVRPVVNVMSTRVSKLSALESSRFEKFSSWKRLCSAIALLKGVCRERTNINNQETKSHSRSVQCIQNLDKAEMFIIQLIQQESFGEEIKDIQTKGHVAVTSSISTLSPILDEKGLLRVGGRLQYSNLNYNEKHPVIIPKGHHIGTLLVRHFHEEVAHQGRHFTEGAVRSAGFWIISCKRLINNLISQCVTCRRIRGKMEFQKMADLPPDRLKPCPAFTYVGVDVFGPWQVVARRTRGGIANNKRWAVLFTCLTCRAIHIEVISDMSSSAFINALRRFIAIRGKVKEFRSDRGSNFIGSIDSLNVQPINVEDRKINQFLKSNKSVWIFNSPHSSHMGGVWERMIGITRRILETMMNEPDARHLTHEVLTTLMAEVSAIVNGRPLVSVSSDPEEPEVLSPSTILTHKSCAMSGESIELDITMSYKSQWKFVQVLADRFWNRWRSEYLQTLQKRVKWCTEKQPVKENDVVLLRDKTVCRNDWPIGIIEKTLPSHDGLVRKVIVRIAKDGKTSTYTRPINEIVKLCSEDN